MKIATTALLTLTACTGLTNAQVSYSVSHNFSFQPTGDVVDVTGADFKHVWIRALNGGGETWTVRALVQDPQFDPFGTESIGLGAGGAPSVFNSGLLAIPVECKFDTFNIPPAGINSATCIILPLFSSWATACTEFFVFPYSPVPPFNIQGSIESSGGVLALDAECYAYSSAAIHVRGGILLANGHFQWSPTIMSDIVGAGVSDLVVVSDPIHFNAVNLDTGVTVEATLLDYSLDMSGDGLIQWAGDLFESDLQDLDFAIDIPPTFTTPGSEGTMHLRVENGVVTISDDTGIFDGLLPPAGVLTPLSFILPNDISLGYDLNLDPAFPWDVSAELSGAGGASAVNPNGAFCPADFNGDGDLNFFDISAFLTAFSDADPQADFNKDGDFNFFDISAFLKAFGAGCKG